MLKREFGEHRVAPIAPLRLDAEKKMSTKKKNIKIANTISDKYDSKIAEKVRCVLSQYPDLGLYLTQICEKSGEDKETVQTILDNSFWSRREGRRYFFIDVSDLDIVTESMFEEESLTYAAGRQVDMKSDDIDMKKIQLLDDPELLIKQLMKEKNIISDNRETILKGTKTEYKEKRTISTVPPKWEREEVVILVTEYFRTKKLSAEKIEESQHKVSEFLRKREEQINGSLVDETFRNYAGIHMQSGRIRCLDPETKYFGMQGTKLQSEIVQEYLADPQKLIDEAEMIVKKYGGTL